MTGRIADLLQAQWELLRGWLNEVDLERCGDRGTGLGTWTVSDLVAHLGLGLGMLTEVRPAQPGATPLSFGRYVASYPPAASTIAEQTNVLAGELRPDILKGVDAIVVEAWAALHTLKAPVVVGRRGPITSRDYLLTRLLELVVHADDLERALPALGWSPTLDEAVSLVADTLADAYEERTGNRPRVASPLLWIRVAAGRVSTDDPELPLL